MTDQTIVFYLGKIVERAPIPRIVNAVRHPNTKARLWAVLLARSARLAKEIVLAGAVPSPLNPPGGCAGLGSR
jgi:ABC-type oligopeptide transport system ATPase subunit